MSKKECPWAQERPPGWEQTSFLASLPTAELGRLSEQGLTGTEAWWATALTTSDSHSATQSGPKVGHTQESNLEAPPNPRPRETSLRFSCSAQPGIRPSHRRRKSIPLVTSG